VISIRAYDRHVEQIFEVVERLAQVLSAAGIPYRVVGGLAVFLHVSERDPLAARMTRDIDIVIDRRDLLRVREVVQPLGCAFRHAAGVDMLVDAAQPKARSAIHLIFAREKVRPDYPEPAPDLSQPVETPEGVLLAPVADLVRMKLTSYRLKDRVHLQDLDAVGLITADIEAQLPEVLLQRLRELRAAGEE
jgi:hypothetical protein